MRKEFHIPKLFEKDKIKMVYSHIDRIITVGFVPVEKELNLEAGKELAANYFLERREMACINIGGKGIITVDGTEYVMNSRDGIYIGKGIKIFLLRVRIQRNWQCSMCTYSTRHIEKCKWIYKIDGTFITIGYIMRKADGLIGCLLF